MFTGWQTRLNLAVSTDWCSARDVPPITILVVFAGTIAITLGIVWQKRIPINADLRSERCATVPRCRNSHSTAGGAYREWRVRWDAGRPRRVGYGQSLDRQ